MRRFCLSAAAMMAVFSLAAANAAAQASAGPEPAPLPPPIVAPADTPYPGTIDLSVNLTNTTDRVATVDETIPVRPGKLVLLYPQWIPGEHAPEGPIEDLAGLFITANGQQIPWVRDRVNMYAFHVDVPQGVTSLDVKFDYLSAMRPQDGSVQMSNTMTDLSWNTVVLYPAGHFSRDIHITPSAILPDGWKYATALETASQDGSTVHFKKTTLNTLVDSPLGTGKYFLREDLSTGPDNNVHLDVFGDNPQAIQMSPEELQDHKNLVVQAQRLWASHHYNHYDFLFFLSNTLSGEGLEHHQSSQDGTRDNYFTEWKAGVGERDLLAHEYTHSWNGKFRRPNDLWTPNFNVPMQDDLLWVYEGLTQYYGEVLTARAGMRTPEETRDILAEIAASFEDSPGRDWRPLVDTTNEEILSERRPVSWVSWSRSEDYYMEGVLVWLDVDTKIRELSGGKKSLDDFAKEFYGINNGSFVTVTYDFDNIVDALNKVQPYDWKTLLNDLVYKLHPQVPLDGFTQGGYKLIYNDIEPGWAKMGGFRRYGTSYATSLGFSVMRDGTIAGVAWGSPAFKAGLVPGITLLAVNGNAIGAPGPGDPIDDAILQAEKDTAPIHFVVRKRDKVVDVDIDYHGGLRHPHLERIPNTPDRLDDILAAVK